AEVAGEAAQQRPARRQRDPEEDEIDEGLVERRHLRHGQEGERNDGKSGHCLRQVAGGVHSHSGSHSRMAISTEKDTTGAQAGAMTAMALDSPADRERSALNSR